MLRKNYNLNVFINCPFDDDYLPLFHSLIFTIFDCGYVARCALEIDDSGVSRIAKIDKIISECKLGIHDISRTELDKKTNLPRFNMPLELGIFLGAKKFGDEKQQKKQCLILDKDPHRYQRFISDIAGQDIKAHSNTETGMIAIVRNFLDSLSHRKNVPGGIEIQTHYELFKTYLPNLCQKFARTPLELAFNDYSLLVTRWLKNN